MFQVLIESQKSQNFDLQAAKISAVSSSNTSSSVDPSHTSTSTPSPNSEKKTNSNMVAVVAGVVCGIAAVAGITAVAIWLKRKSQLEREQSLSEAGSSPHHKQATDPGLQAQMIELELKLAGSAATSTNNISATGKYYNPDDPSTYPDPSWAPAKGEHDHDHDHRTQEQAPRTDALLSGLPTTRYNGAPQV
jgi:hypothetical protein